MWPTYSVEELMVLGHILRDQALLKADESHLTAPSAAKIQGCQKFLSFIIINFDFTLGMDPFCV